MNNTKRKRGGAAQGACKANGASRPTGESFKDEILLRGMLSWAKDYVAEKGDMQKNLNDLKYWQSQYLILSDKLLAAYETIDRLRKEKLGDDFDDLDELDL